LLNVNLEISRRLLDLTEKQRALRISTLLEECVDETGGDTVLLDNAEILFDVALKQDPLRLLEKISRNKTIVVAWNGSIENGNLVYATQDHPEYHRYPVRDSIIVSPAR